jgi:hyperosmotically inducible periplasmic protein
MQSLLLLTFLVGLSTGLVAQTSQPAAQASSKPMAAPQSQNAAQVVTSNGPVVAGWGEVPEPIANTVEGKLAREVRHELLLLPYYSIFDDLEYQVQGRTVTLSGYLTAEHSQTKPDAEAVVKRIEGVEKVVNNIKVLSPSPLDQQARRQVFNALVRTGGLSQYFWEAAPSIHIIVENLHCTLVGYVNREGDKDLAGITAKQVRSLFSVTNDLHVVK